MLGMVLHEGRVTLPFALLIVLLAFRFPDLGARWFRSWEALYCRWADNPRQRYLVCGLASLFFEMLLVLLWGVPIAGVHDEFSYFLASDTLAHGHLANPQHPLWIFFESFHILVHPTYASKYPPGQGLLMAFGQVLFGKPIIAIWIMTPLACVALCWMLCAWVPPRWALLGGLLAGYTPSVLAWSHNYLGGAMALFGGSLVLGAIPRLLQNPRTRYSALLGLGLAILAVTRSYEGLALCLAILISLCLPCWPVDIRKAIGPILRVSAPFFVIIGLAIVGLGLYNRAVTGSPLKLTYSLQEDEYDPFPLFWIMPPRHPIVYHHEAIRAYYMDIIGPDYYEMRSPRTFLKTQGDKIAVYLTFARPYTMLIPFLFLPWAIRRDWGTRTAAVLLVLFVPFTLLQNWMADRYLAPVVGLLTVVFLSSLRELRTWQWNGRAVGLTMSRLILLSSLINLPVGIAKPALAHLRGHDLAWSYARERIVNQLMHAGGNHLIIVRYAPGHSPHEEWVYNDADIDHSRIVWARDMGEVADRQLLDYFRGRQVWLLDADAKPPKLTPYPSTSP